ncbi:MAG: hypothetical protein COB50_02505 [Thiotrichales bacterium]|nr:MAG: hypothetical protein COB50_02505 [Thiotrichales bacterium]
MQKSQKIGVSLDDKTYGIVSAYAKQHNLSFSSAFRELALLGNQFAELKANLKFEGQLFGEDKLMLNEKRSIYLTIRTGLLVMELAKQQLSEASIAEQEELTKKMVKSGWYYTNGDDEDDDE